MWPDPRIAGDVPACSARRKHLYDFIIRCLIVVAVFAAFARVPLRALRLKALLLQSF
jgi:hypothetical protein